MSNLWTIKDADGNVTNACIKGTEDFVAANFDHYEAFVAPTPTPLTDAEEVRRWRDEELTRTDTLHLLDDYPNASNLTAYRAALRAWPSTSDFPDTKPVLGS
jgi:hypothetical protein